MVERGPTNGECITMTLQERVTKVYAELFHHIPDLDKKDDATEYAVLHTALRAVMEACKQVAEQYATGGPGCAMPRTKLPLPLSEMWESNPSDADAPGQPIEFGFPHASHKRAPLHTRRFAVLFGELCMLCYLNSSGRVLSGEDRHDRYLNCG